MTTVQQMKIPLHSHFPDNSNSQPSAIVIVHRHHQTKQLHQPLSISTIFSKNIHLREK